MERAATRSTRSRKSAPPHRAPKKHALKKYRQKRDFTVTSEPSGVEATTAGQSFVVQKHAASHLHYDFRLEMDGVLKSWAVAKGPSVDPAVKRLAVEVEDHPLAYGGFEGTIPKGQYGGGTVMLWDQGTWHPTEDPDKGLRAGRLKFQLKGKKMKGLWALVRMKPRPGDRNPNWLLIKDKDEAAAPGDADKLLKQDKSVKTKRSMDGITTGKSAVWHSNQPDGSADAVPKNSATPKTQKPKAQKKSPAKSPPNFIAPQLTTRVDEPPEGEDWLHEIKFDGYRLLTRLNGGAVKILTRHGKDWTAKFSDLTAELTQLPVQNAYLDGEVVLMDKHGVSDFGALQNWFKEPGGQKLIYYVFDLLFMDGHDLRQQPLTARKELLQSLLQNAGLTNVLYSDHQTGHGAAFFKSAAGMGLEGIISKAANSVYTSDRTRDWLKIKRIERQEFVIGGYTLSTNSDTAIGALLMGEHENGKLRYAGKVGTGYSVAMARELFRKLSKISTGTSPFSETLPSDVRRTAHWTKPQLVAEVEFGAWTSDRILRHAAFMGLREDKEARDVKTETVMPIEKATKAPGVKKRATAKTKMKPRKTAGQDVAGITISHPDRVIYPKEHITKHDVAAYYEAVGEIMLPHVANRPLALVRCPDGVGPACFFQKHAGAGMPESIREQRIGSGKGDNVLLIDSVEGLVSLVQRGVLEVHTWGTHIDHVEQPDILVFDFDPDPDLKWKVVMQAALDMRETLKRLGLKSFVKMTGGKGLHVAVPIKPQLEWDAAKQFCKSLATKFAATDTDLYVTNMSLKVRKNHIFIDYLRNGRGATFIAPYGTRARPGAQIAMPLSWKDLEAGATPQDFTMENVLKKISGRFKDPWADLLTTKQALTVKMIEALGEE